MDVSELVGQELSAVEFVSDYLQLRFDGPLVTFFAWPHVLLKDSSFAFGEPEYRDMLCAQIGDEVTRASIEEGDAATIEFQNGVVFGLSLRLEDLDTPEAGSYSATGQESDSQEF